MKHTQPHWQLCVILSVLAFFCSAAITDPIYKIVDKDGKVTYSSDAPETSDEHEVITLDIDPDSNIIKPESDQTTPQLKQQYNQRYPQKSQPQKKGYQEKLAQAKAAVEAAKTAIEEGKKVQQGDFIGKKSPGVRPSLQRQTRLQQLQEALEAAEKNLKKTIKENPY